MQPISGESYLTKSSVECKNKPVSKLPNCTRLSGWCGRIDDKCCLLSDFYPPWHHMSCMCFAAACHSNLVILGQQNEEKTREAWTKSQLKQKKYVFFKFGNTYWSHFACPFGFLLPPILEQQRKKGENHTGNEDKKWNDRLSEQILGVITFSCSTCTQSYAEKDTLIQDKKCSISTCLDMN